MKFLGKYRSAKEMYENEDKENLKKIFKHGKPTSRREFLSSGALGFSAALTASPIISLLAAKSAGAQTICSTPAKSMPSLITLNLAGGFAISGNMIPHDQGRQLLSSYTRLGLGSQAQTH